MIWYVERIYIYIYIEDVYQLGKNRIIKLGQYSSEEIIVKVI